nr:porin [Caballeronia sordidicola]
MMTNRSYKIKFTVAAFAGFFASVEAYSQSSVTLYGVVDQSIRYTTSADAENKSSVQLTNGAITNSRWGLKGSEDLGGNLKAFFALEDGFEPQSGQVDGALFGRKAYVGLSNEIGSVKLGRQDSEAFTFYGSKFDPLTVANYVATEWPFFLSEGRVNNTVNYDGRFSGLDIGASYGFGQQAGSLSANSYWGAHASYTQAQFAIGTVYQQFRDTQSHTQEMWGASARYTLGLAELYLGYLGGSDATGVLDKELLNNPSRTVIYGSYVTNPRRDLIVYTGVDYQVTPTVEIRSAFYYDSMKNVNGLSGNSGKRYTGVVVAEYSLSKATQVYATADYNEVKGGAYTELPGKSNSAGLAVGLRHSF